MRNYKIKILDNDTKKVEKHTVGKLTFAEAAAEAQRMIHMPRFHGKRIVSIQEA
jgi:hypothetical protein